MQEGVSLCEPMSLITSALQPSVCTRIHIAYQKFKCSISAILEAHSCNMAFAQTANVSVGALAGGSLKNRTTPQIARRGASVIRAAIAPNESKVPGDVISCENPTYAPARPLALSSQSLRPPFTGR